MAGVVGLAFGLADVAEAGWPAGCALRYRVEIGPALRLALEVESRGPAPLAFEEALHPDLAVDDVERISVTGLEARVARRDGGLRAEARRIGPLVVRGETDRIYDETRAPASCRIRSRAAAWRSSSWAPMRRSCGTRARCARALPDLGGDEWPPFLCVESGNVGLRAVAVAPGARHRLAVSIRSELWHGG